VHRYGSLEFTKKLTFKQTIKIINKSFEEENKEKLFRIYLSLLPHMERQISFNDYYKKHTKVETPKIMDRRNEEEIMAEILAIK